MKLNDTEINFSSIKTLSYSQLSLLCSNIREEIIKDVSLNGGHLSSNLGAVELEVALCHFFDFNKDIILFDVGHQAYTYKLINGEDLSNLRRENGESGFNKKGFYEGGHASTSISAACGIALGSADKNVISFIGDGSISSGLALEGLNDLCEHNTKIIIILNDNGMSISKSRGQISKELIRLREEYSALKGNWDIKHTKNIFENFGLCYIPPVDGHDIPGLEKAFASALKNDKSTLIHVVTKKGKGYPIAEEDDFGYAHNVRSFDINNPSIDPNGVKSYSAFAGAYLDKKLAYDKNAIVICPSMMIGCKLENVYKNHPQQYIDCGICENHAINLASGLSRSGKKVYVVTYSTFFQRAYDNIFVDLALQKLNVTLLVDRAGLSGEDGESHQGVYDVAYFSSIPGVIICCPSDEKTFSALLELKTEGVNVIRYPKYTISKMERVPDVRFGKWIKEYSFNSKKVIITYGYLVETVIKIVKDNNLSYNVVNALFLNPADEDMLLEFISYVEIIVIDGMSVKQGLVSKVESFLFENNYQGKFFFRAITHEFIAHGSVDEQLKRYGFDTDSILRFINTKKAI